MKKKKALRTSLLGMLLFVVVLLSVTLALCGFYIYRQDMVSRYQNYAGDAIDFIARCVDGDDLETCIETGVKSEKYEALQRLANDFKETHDLVFIYIIKPLKIEPPHNMMDVFAAWTSWGKADGTDGLTDLGVITEYAYPADVAAQYMARMDRDPTITYFRNDTEFGDIYTAIRPIFNSAGEPVAVLCGDIEINAIYGAAKRYALSAGLIALAFAALVLAAVSLWIERRIAGPIGKLQDAARGFEDKCRRRAEIEALVMDDPDIHTGDEIEGLSDSIVSMVQDVQGYARDLQSYERRMAEQEKKLGEIGAMARQDAMTHVKNRYAYLELKATLAPPFAVVIADLNGLKTVNDALGHDRGDDYIINCCDMICKVYKHSPVFRIGGDEFAVVLKNRDYDNRDALLRELRARIEASRADASKAPWERCSFAVGMSECAEGEKIEDAFARADQAMYEDKNRMKA